MYNAHTLMDVGLTATQLAQAAAALIAITNPLNAASTFVSLTESANATMRRRAVRRVCIVVTVILVGTAFGGIWVLRAFGISVPAFQAAGGLVVLLMGLEMLRGQHSRVQHDHPHDTSPSDQVIVPLAIPIIAGPGTMTTVISLTGKQDDGSSMFAILLAIVATIIVLYVSLKASAWIDQRMTARTHRIFVRFMGLILLAIGVQLSLAGIHSFWNHPA
jgi:multiple antibiotic resistance protein